jgi:hypothetical protein
MKIAIVFLLLNVSFIKCLKSGDFCYPNKRKEFMCSEKYNFNCANFICTKNQYSCHVLSLFSALNGALNKKKYGLFIDKIEKCNEYIWKINDVCLIPSKYCNQKESIFRRWSNKNKKQECKCNGKFNFECHMNNYCGLNKRACDGLLIRKKIIGIKQCAIK